MPGLEYQAQRISAYLETSSLLTLMLYPITIALFAAAATLHYRGGGMTETLGLALAILFLPIMVKYGIQLVVAVCYPLQRPRASAAHPTTPSVSVIIPAWNEEVGIVETIRSVVATGYRPLEIIIINDGSTDGTEEAVRTYLAGPTAADGPPVRYRRVPNGGKARALNLGLAMAEGEIVVTIDADSVMDANFLRNITTYLERQDVVAAAGRVVIGNRQRPVGLLQQLEYLYGFYFKRAEAVMGAVYIVGGAAAAYRRKIVAELGGFDETIITEDIELSTRLQHHGYRVGYAADAIVFTEGPSDFRSLCRQRLRWKHGRLLTFLRYRTLFGSLRPEHSKFLTLLVMPAALYGEALLLAEPLLLPAFLTYTLVTRDLVPLAGFVLIMTGVICMQILVDRARHQHRNLFAVAPVAWLLFCWLDLVEFQALVRSLARLATGREVTWQRWDRRGVFDGAAAVPRPAAA